MNAFNGLVTRLFDILLVPLELMGDEMSLILVSGIFGVLALIVFKYISSQKGIKAAKDKIKGHMIAIRLYQDDLVIVGKSIAKVLLRNLQYVSLNFGPFIPLAPIFVVVLAQAVVRYGFEPLEVVSVEQEVAMLPGAGNELKIEFKGAQKNRAAELEVIWPEGLTPRSPLVRNAREGVAFQEFVATAPGDYEVELRLSDGSSYTKKVSAGSTDLACIQPERVSDSLTAFLWPAEAMFPPDCPIASVGFVYPDSDLGWLPMAGLMGVMVVFVVASMVFAFAFIKPLGVQI
jgi:hypothetical protein